MNFNIKRPLRAAGYKGKVLADVMAWFGDGHVHRQNRYASDNIRAISQQFDLMQHLGFDGIVVTWQGPIVKFVHAATMLMWEECYSRDWLFGILLDPWAARTGPGNLDENITAALNSDDFLTWFNSDVYLPEGYIVDYSTGANYANVHLPPGAEILMNQSGYGWANAYASGDYNRTLRELQDTNKRLSMKIPAIEGVFLDAGYPLPPNVTPAEFTGQRDYGKSVWGGEAARCIDHQAGNFFLDSVEAIKLCPTPPPYVHFVTWNDYDEQTAIEWVFAALEGIRLGS